eukprot:scaffold7915_cov152-Skeletonema_menzelii.AAC.9
MSGDVALVCNENETAGLRVKTRPLPPLIEWAIVPAFQCSAATHHQPSVSSAQLPLEDTIL